MRSRRITAFLAVGVLSVMIGMFLGWRLSLQNGANQKPPHEDAPSTRAAAPASSSSDILVFAHNLLLKKGPNFRVYVQWLRGHMARTQSRVIPSFDNPDSFYLDITNGVLRANLGDLGNFLNAGLQNAPLRNIRITGNEEKIRLTGTLHKLIPIPVQLDGIISAAEDGRVHVHVTHFDVLKVPVKGFLGIFRVSLADIFKQKIDGLEVDKNEMYFDTLKLLPPPHIRGHLTRVHVANPDLEEIFGDAKEDLERTEEWRNFLRLRGGKLDFGTVTMNRVDLMMIDISKDPWFNLDLTDYQTQLTNSYSRVTSKFGVQIFMPDLRDLPPQPPKDDDNIEWFKHRNIPPPAQISSHLRKQ